jgi:hypothetical protein
MVLMEMGDAQSPYGAMALTVMAAEAMGCSPVLIDPG